MACLCRKSNGIYKIIIRIVLSKENNLVDGVKGVFTVCSVAVSTFQLISTFQPQCQIYPSQSLHTHFFSHCNYLSLSILISPPLNSSSPNTSNCDRFKMEATGPDNSRSGCRADTYSPDSCGQKGTEY